MAYSWDLGRVARGVHNGRHTVSRLTVADSELLQLVLESVHPANLGPLPPSPATLAYKGVQIGLAKNSHEFFKSVVIWRAH